MKKYIAVLTLILIPLFCFTQTKNNLNIELANHYYQNQEYKKAISVYKNLADKSSNIQAIHEAFFDALLTEKSYKICKAYFKKILKWFADNPQYNIDYGVYLSAIGQEEKALKHYDDYLDKISSNHILLNPAGQYFMKYKRYGYAEQTYLMGIKIQPTIFGIELANLYKIQDQHEKAIMTYLDILEINIQELENIEGELTEYVQTSPILLEKLIFQYIHKNTFVVFNELLAWYYIQKKEFYKAFIQVKSVDKRKKLLGYKLLELAEVTLDYKDYDMTITILEYVIDKYTHVKRTYYLARKELIRTQELQIKNTFPVDLKKVKNVVNNYKKIIEQKTRTNSIYSAFEEQIGLAKLYAFYLDRKDTAIKILKSVLNVRLHHDKRASAMMTLADIYVLKNEPWEATLLYLKVQEEYRGSPEANLAKFKNAKVYYFSGNFRLSKGYLDVIKLATDRKTANDAIALSMFIDDNSGLDTTDILLRRFTAIELLVYQNKYEQAIIEFDTLLADCKSHPLGDDILWQQSSILRKIGKFEQAIEKLKELVKEYSYNILADDANFTIGLIYEENLKNIEEAKKYYKQHLLNFKGSWYTTEARQRYRLLVK